MPVDKGGGRGSASTRPVTKPPPKRASKPRRPRPDELAFGADVGLFTPAGLVTPVAPVRGERDKVPVPFPIAPTKQQTRIAAEAKADLARTQRARDAIKAPVDLGTRARVRRGETAAEKKTRTAVAPPSVSKGILNRVADTRGLIGLGETTGKVTGQLAADATKAALGGLLAAANQGVGESRRTGVPLEATAAVQGAKAAVTPLAYMTVGPDLMNAVVGLEHSNAGLAFDLAMLPLAAGGRPIKGVRALGAAAKAGAKGKALEEIADIAGEAYASRSVLQARRASSAHKDLVDAAVKTVALSPSHGRALKVQVAANTALEDARAALKLAKPKEKEQLEKVVKQRVAERAAANQEELYHRLRAEADYMPLEADDPRLPGRAQVAKDLHSTLKGRKGALPQGSGPRRTLDLFTFLDELADKGERGRMWYENSARAILELAQGDKVIAERIAQLLAIYSPQQNILGNTGLAIRAYNEFLDTGKVTVGDIHKQRKAMEVLNGGDFEGRKTNNFYVNFLEDIDKEKFDAMVAAGDIRPDGVTIDQWMARVFGYRTDNVSEGRYDFMEPIVRQLAAERPGWKPKQVQAAIWTAIKDASYADKSRNIDFVSGIEHHVGQFNFEAATGDEFGSSFADVYNQMSPELQRQFMEANAVLVDQFLREAGMLVRPSRLGPGVYDTPTGIEVNPGASAEFVTSAAPRGKDGYKVSPVERELLDAAAAAIGQALEQNSVAWVRPFEATSIGHSSAIAIKFGRPATNAEAKAVAAALGTHIEGIAVMASKDGLILRNWLEALPNIARRKSEVSFHDVARQAVNDALPDTDVRLAYHASDGGLVESGDYADHLRNARDRGRSSGDVRLSEAADRLARDAAELRSRFGTLAEPGARAGGVERFEQGARVVDEEGFAGTVTRISGGRVSVLHDAGTTFKYSPDQLTREGEEVADPQARLEQLETFLKPYLDSAYQVVRQADPASTIGKDRRVRRAATDADRFKTAAIGVGDPVDLSSAPLISPRHGPTADRERAEKIIYEAAKKSEGPVASKIVEAFDEIDQIRAAELARAEAEFEAALDAHGLAKERQATSWLDQMKSLTSAENAALSALPLLAGVDDPMQLGAAAVGSAAALEVGRRGIARSAARGLDAPYMTRTLRTGGFEQQLPRARSEISQAATRIIDRTSEALDKTFVTDVPGIRIVTAHARVPKAAGRVSRQAAIRRPAKVRGALNTVSHLKEGSFEDVAHFWYAQLPADFRNVDGLTFIRHAQQEELDEITSGRMSARIEDTIKALQIQIAESETGAFPGQLLKEIEGLRVLLTDLDQRAIDVGASINKMDELIAHPPEVDEDVIAALRTLSEDRKQVLIDSGRLDPERAGNREELVARELDLEPDGSEVYIGHRLPPGVDTSPRVASVSAGTGRVSSPKGVGTRNRFILARTGRLRPSTHVALEDWSAAQVFIQSNEARDVLGRLGEPFKNRFKEGYTLINPKGRTIPPHWKTDELAAFSEGADDITETRELAQDLVNTFASQNQKDMQRIVDEAAEQGVHWSELRLVPNYQVDRYFKQFRSFSGRSAPAVVYDAMVDAAATSIVFARIGYIPKNVVQNLIMMVPHQGAFFPMNAVRSAQVLADPQLRFLFQGEIGASGASKAIGNERATKGPTKWALGKVAHFMGSIADDPARMSAFLHEAAAEGVIGRFSFNLTNKDRKALVKLLTDPKQEARLNDIRSRSVEAMADFTRLTPDQARMARRFLIIPGWLMAGSRYPFHFAGTHPIRSALMAYVLLGEPGAPEELQFNNRVDSYFTGHDYLRGIDTPWGRLRTSSLNPISTPWDIAQGAVGSVRGRKSPFDFETPTLLDFGNPVVAAGIDFFGGEAGGLEGLERIGKRLLPGSYGLVKGLVAPEASSSYPEDETALGRLKREVGVIPIRVSDEKKGKKPPSSRKRPGSGGRPRPGSGGRKRPGS